MAGQASLNFDFESYGVAFLARDLHRLRVVISEQSDAIFEEIGLSIPSHCASLVLFLDQYGDMPVMKIADGLGYSHQLVNQRIALLDKSGSVRKYRDVNDRRRSLVRLTSRGRAEAKKIRRALPAIDAGIKNVLSVFGADLKCCLIEARQALLAKPLAERGRSQTKPPRKTARAAKR